MDKTIYKQNALAMLELVICSIKGEIPSSEFIETLNFEALFKVCQKHILTACVAYALESAGIQNKEFSQAKEKSIRKNILLDADRNRVCQRLEQEKIWHMPLKGAILKDWYPKLGMRQMSDNDILYDGKYRQRIKEIMLELGFSCEHFEENNDDSYFKLPVSNFEMHNELFTIAHIGKLHQYYTHIKEKLIQDENSNYSYHFRIEDFYIYITAHDYKHFASYGIGIRSLVDNYIFIQKWGNLLDWDYIQKELKTLEIADYERHARELATKLFSRSKLTAEENELLDYYIFSGTYGTFKNKVENEFQRNGHNSKIKYLFHRLFPPMNHIEMHWNFFYRHKWLLPVLFLYRPIYGLITKRKKIREELKNLFQSKDL